MPTAMDLEIGKAAVGAGLVTQQQLEECLGVLHAIERKGGRKDLLTMLIQRGYLTPEQARQIPGVSAGMVERATKQAPDSSPPTLTEPDETSAGVPPPSESTPYAQLRAPKPGVKLSQYAFINLTGEGKWEICHLPEKPVAIGRDPANDVVVNDQPVSGRHARLTFANNEMTLWDVGSKNGTFVNTERISNRKLSPGDVVGVGRARLIFVKGVKPDGTTSGLLSPTATEAGAQAIFLGKAGFKPSEKFFLGNSPLFIGREKCNNIVLDDATVSPFHAQIAKTSQGVRIQDLNSRAGVLVNGQKVSVATLQPDDLITIGKFTLFCQEILGKRGTGVPKVTGGKEDLSTIITDLGFEEKKAEPSHLGAALLKELQEKAALPDTATAAAKPSTTRGPTALRLTCLVGPIKDKSFPLGKRILTIGRNPSSDVFLEDLAVSREHAMIRPVGDRVEIVDLGSRNGVEVNGKRVKSHHLNVGDKIAIGKCLFLVEAAE